MASNEVSRSLSEIDAKVKDLNASIKSLEADNKKLDSSLKLNPNNINLLHAKMNNYSQAVAKAEEKVKLLKSAQNKLKEEVANGRATQAEYDKLSVKVSKAEAEVNNLNYQIKKTNEQSLNKITSGMQKLSKAAMVALTTLAAMEVAYASTGDAISKASDKYNISAEEFQYASHLFDKTTNSTNGYTNALKEMASKLAQVEKGSGETIKAFESLGISAESLKGLSASEALDLLMDKLSSIADVDNRLIAANVILSSTGSDVAMVAGLTNEEIANLNQELESMGILTQEEADNAAYLNDRITDFKNAISKITAETAEKLIPAMEALLSVGVTVIEIVAGLANIFNIFGSSGQKVFVILLLVVAILPKLVTVIKAVNAAMTLLGANPINIKIMLICAAVALLIILLVKLFGWLTKCFGRKYSLDVDTSSIGTDVASLVGDTTLATNSILSTGGNTNNTTTYYDYSTVNVEAHTDADIESIAEELSTKIRVGG